ncbi:MAG: MFS transporter [archaeon]|nr:MFS transporter [archaeon]MCP8305907.1 MFS transporter [archaeon]
MEKGLTEFLERAPLSRFHYILLVMGSLVYGFTAMNYLLLPPILPAISKEWALDLPTQSLILSLTAIGMFIGALSCGIIADLLGRRKALLLTIVMMTAFTGLSSFAWDALSLSILRFLAGIGLGGSLPQPGVYVSEYVPAKSRGRFLGLIESAWAYGAVLAIIFPFYLIKGYGEFLGWRLTFLMGFIPLLLIPLILRFLPESIRYLENKGMGDEAWDILERHGLASMMPDGGSPEDRNPLYSVKSTLKEVWSPMYGRRTAMLWISWAVLVYTYHGIFLWLPTIAYVELTAAKELLTPLYFVLLVTLLQIPGYYSATFLLDSIGRKPVLVSYLALAGLGSLLFGQATGVFFFLFLMGVISFFNLGAWAGLYAYTPELYPTSIRGTGSGLSASIGRLTLIFAPIITGYLWWSQGAISLMFLVFAVVHFLGAICVLILGIETKGKVLEEISKPPPKEEETKI